MTQPLINILVRTSKRPKFFANCVESIRKQTYKNVNVLISVDNYETEEYVKPYGYKYIRVFPRNKTDEDQNIIDKFIGAYYAPHNLYLNQLMYEIHDGWVMFLDDDDVFMNDNALEIISKKMIDKDALILWKVKVKNKIVPNEQNWLKKPELLDISGIGFSIHSKHKEFAWDQFNCSDFRIISAAYHNLSHHEWIDDILTGTQVGAGYGKQEDINYDYYQR